MAAASLAAEIVRLDPAAALRGVGGPRMAAAGVTVLVESSTWSAIGHVDPLLRLRTHLRRLRQVEELIPREAPAGLPLIDLSAFNPPMGPRPPGALPRGCSLPPLGSGGPGKRAGQRAHPA